MDAKPHRARPGRLHDENMLPNGGAPPNGKTLRHGRTKSSPALSSLLQAGAAKAANKKVLCEVNANAKLARPVRDDSEIGKVSPHKIEAQEKATLARPAARPLGLKSADPSTAIGTSGASAAVTDPVAASAEQLPAAQPSQALKLAAKKCIKVFQGAQPEPEGEGEAHKTAPPAQPAQESIKTGPVVDNDKQEVRKTESVPLRNEPVAKLTVQPVVPMVHGRVYVPLPPGFASEQDYLAFIQHKAHLHSATHGPNVQYLPTPQPEQYYECDEEEYYADDGYTTARSFILPVESTGGFTLVTAPQFTDETLKELAAAKVFVDAHRTVEDIEDDQWDTSMVAEYGDEIFSYMRELEVRLSPNPHYMDQQTEIQWSMRGVLMDWIIQVHQRFNLLPETLYLAANYVDRFLSCKVVSLGKLQLVGATAIFVAAKYEEVQCPTINEIVYMVDGGYSADELLKAERFMLTMLQFELGWPGPMSFLRRISKADDYDLETRTLAKYFLEITLMDERFLGCNPSFLAAGAHCLARLMLRKGEWTEGHVYYSQYTYSQLRQLLAGLVECCEDPKKHHSAVFDKYADKRYKRASTFVATEIANGFHLPIFPLDPALGAY